MHSNKPGVFYKMNICALYVSIYVLGYPVFSLLSQLTNIENLTVLYRVLCLVIGAGAFFLAIVKKETEYTLTQILLIFWQIIYLCFVLYYFSMGFENDSLTLDYYLNNILTFSLIPVFLINFKVDEYFVFCTKKYLMFFVFIFVFLVFVMNFFGFSEEYRLSFEKLNPISLSYYSAICILIVFWCLESSIISSSLKIGLLYIMILSGSRGPLLSLIIVSFIVFINQLKLKNQAMIIIFMLLSLIFLLSNFDYIINNFPILSRFNIYTDEGEMSISIRQQQYASAMDIFLSNPLFGGGLVEKVMNYYPHNIFLEILMTGGIFFASIFISIAAYIIRLFRLSNHSRDFKFLCMISAVLSISYMFSSSLATIGLLYFLLTIASKLYVCDHNS